MPTPDDFTVRAGRARDTSAIKSVFNDIASLPDAAAQKALDVLEQGAIGFIRAYDNPTARRQIDNTLNLIEQLKYTREEALYRRGFEIEEGAFAAAQAELFRRLAREKGSNASPVVTAFLAEAAKLQPGEFGSALGHYKVVKAVLESGVTKEPAPKPSGPKPTDKSQNFDF